MGEVGGRQAFAHPALDHRLHLLGLAVRQAGIEEGFEPVERQVQGMQDQIGRLVEGIVGAMAEKQFGLVEARHGEAQPVAHGDQGFGVFEVFHRAGSGQGQASSFSSVFW